MKDDPMEQIKFICNDQDVSTKSHPAVSVLDFVRKELRLTGTKEGCREGDCGACTVLVGELRNERMIYKSVNSCLLPIAALHGKHVVTIEGLNQSELTPIQHAFVDEGASQCGFCTPGFLISLTGYLLSGETLNANEAVEALGGNVCRCTGYASIKRAVAAVMEGVSSGDGKISEHLLFEQKIIPGYFSTVAQRLKNIELYIPEKETGVVISGGTDLFVQKWEALLESDVRVLSNESSNEKIWINNNTLFLNARTTVSEFLSSPLLIKYFPQIETYFSYFGSLPIRNRATIGGNILNASPIGDVTNFLLALDADLHFIDKKKNKRNVALKNFYTGYKQFDKKKNELLGEISFKLPANGSAFNYEKVSKRTYLDIASVNSSMYIETEGALILKINISAGGVAPFPLFLSQTCKWLTGKSISIETIKGAVEIIGGEISPISDARGSAEYKKLLLRQLFYAHFIKLFPGRILIEEVV